MFSIQMYHHRKRHRYHSLPILLDYNTGCFAQPLSQEEGVYGQKRNIHDVFGLQYPYNTAKGIPSHL